MDFFKIFITSIISAIGAFLPILGLMYIHFRIRKNFYNQLYNRFNQEIENYKNKELEYEGYLNVHRKRFDFEDNIDLSFNSELKKE